MKAVLQEADRRREARKEDRERTHRDIVNSSARVVHISRVALARSMARVSEKQHALEGEVKRYRTLAKGLLDRGVQWGGAYQAFRDEVERLASVEDWAFQTEVAMRHLVETLTNVADSLTETEES